MQQLIGVIMLFVGFWMGWLSRYLLPKLKNHLDKSDNNKEYDLKNSANVRHWIYVDEVSEINQNAFNKILERSKK